MNTEKAPLISKDLDYYKPTMSQVEFEKHPDAQVTFTLKNRGANLLSEYVSPDELQARLDTFRGGWQPEELDYLASLKKSDGSPQFSRSYLNYLADNDLPPVVVGLDERGDIAAQTTGDWPLVTFWETVVMSELNELYFQNKLFQDKLIGNELYSDGDRRLSNKIALLKDRPDIKIADFGTRRRFGYKWHEHVVKRFAEELPENFIGTSNVHLARTLGLKAIGTYAHELPMGYAAIADSQGRNPLEGHNEMLRDWEAIYNGDRSIALTDTFTSEFFFDDFTKTQAEAWDGLRHDSGDPIAFGERAIDFYEQYDIDPTQKQIVFSDGLDIHPIITLADHFKGRIAATYGWGTTATNDLGLKPNNIVMKATAVNGTSTVKLSDEIGKHTGDEQTIHRYQTAVAQQLASRAFAGLGV